MKAFLYHASSGRMYEVLGVEDGVITLKNEMATFTDTYDKEKFKSLGYIRVTGETEKQARKAAEAKLAADEEAA